MLHITNGESAVRKIQLSRIPGEVLACIDVLHEGPTLAGLSLEQMGQVRARLSGTFIEWFGFSGYMTFMRGNLKLTRL
jgi:hypothetical protein